MLLRTVLIILLAGLSLAKGMAKTFVVKSPNGKIVVKIPAGEPLNFTVDYAGRQLLQKSAICLNGQRMLPRSGKASVVRHNVDAPFYRQKHFNLEGNQLDIALGNGFGLLFQAYDEGVAYRFYTTRKGETIITDETAAFAFPQDAKAWLAYTTNAEKPFAMAFQNTYHETLLRDAKPLPAFLPATVDCGGVKVTILESDLRNYPGMFLISENSFDQPTDSATTPGASAPGIPAPFQSSLKAAFPRYPAKMDYYKWRGMSYVSQTENYIAKSTDPRTYPWRVLAITESDTQMPVNNLVYALATPNVIGDISWLKPGKVAWDWWNDWNLKGVDFEAGINTRTYQYYIDFAAKNDIPYVVLDEGWYDSNKGDIMNPVADIDLPALIDYGRQKGVGIVLWTVFNVLDEHLEEACEKYANMGVKGFKVDFLDRNDQTAVEMAERIAAVCALYRLFLDYHGYFAPTGMSRTYPNIMNYEGVFGMEECRWAKKDTDMPQYDVTFPFIRMMAGSVDFTPGAMPNGTKENWVECYQNPVSMGTRCHQAACYVIHDSPFTMLCDAPTNYETEPEYTKFIAAIPDEWEQTRVLQGELGKYIVTARLALHPLKFKDQSSKIKVQKDEVTWYVGGQTNWDARTIHLPLKFLPEGNYTVTLLTDGINANHNAEDYRLYRENHHSSDTLTVKMASGGGFVLKIESPPL